MRADDLNSTGVHRALREGARTDQQEGAEGIYRAVAPLRDLLPADAQKQVAAVFEWAREGIGRQMADAPTPELEALHAAYTYARDVLVASARKNDNDPVA